MEWSDFFNGSCRAACRRGVSLAGALLLVLALGSCKGGGNGGGGGGGGRNQLTVAVSPTAAAVQLNQTLQMSAAVSNPPNLTIATTNGAVRASNVVTITTTAPHGFSVGQGVRIEGVSDTSFIGTFVITAVPSTTTLTYSQTGADASSGGGTIPHTAITWQVNGTAGGNATTGTISVTGLYSAPMALPPVTTANITSSGAARSSNTVTITTAAAHGFTVGQVISVVGVTAPAPISLTIAANGAARASNTVTITTTAAHGLASGQVVAISGVTDTSFNGSFVVTSIPSTTTFTYFQSGTDASSGGGTVSASIAGFDGTFVILTVPSTTTFTYTQNGANATSGGGTVNSSAVKITAVSVADSTKSADASVGLDSGITVSLTPSSASLAVSESFQFSATATGATPTGITWSVNDTVGGSSTAGTIMPGTCPTPAPGLFCGDYVAPGAVPTPAVVTVKAQATADPTKFRNALVTVVAATATPTLTAVWPTVVAQGSVAQDFLIEGSNFLSTTQALWNSVPLPTPPTPVGNNLARVRVPQSFLNQPGTFPLNVVTQGGAMPATPCGAPCDISVTSQRPALVGPSPDSIPAGAAGSVNMNFNGGYFSTTTGATTAELDGATVSAAPGADPSRQLQVTFTPPAAAGLYAISVKNAGASPGIAAANLAIQPSLPSPTTVPVTVGTAPSAVAINTATGMAVVLNRGSATISPSLSLIDLATDTVSASYPVMGTNPTGLAVDNVRNVAVVANHGDPANNLPSSISIIDLATGAHLPFGAPITHADIVDAFAVAVNPLTGLGLVVRNSTSGLAATQATLIDLTNNTVVGTVGTSTNPVATGANPGVAVEPRLNWAIVTPGGIGPVTIVSLGGRDTMGVPTGASVVATALLGSSIRGISVNTETRGLLLVDPTSTAGTLFSALDQSVSAVRGNPASCGNPPCPLETGHVDSAVNPFTNVGLSVNPSTDQVSLYDLGAPNRLLTFSAGGDPVAVDVDPGTNKAVIANQADGTVTIAQLGPIRQQHILQVDPPSLMTSATDLTITVTGFAFTATSVVRADETPLATTLVSSRRLTAVVPAAMLSSVQRFAIDVLDGATRTNVYDLAVVQPITVGTAPVAVAIDPERNFALVTNSGSDDASLIDLSTGAVINTIPVGDNPQGVAFFSRRGTALVTNRSSGNVSVIDIDDPMSSTFATVKVTTPVGTEPVGVAVNEATEDAFIANSISNTVTRLNAFTGIGPATISVAPDVRPVAVAVDPVRDLVAVANSNSNSVSVIDVSIPAVQFRIGNVPGANGVVHDPTSDRFIAAAALLNQVSIIDPVTRTATSARVGINPTSIAYNNNSSTLATVNTASNTISVMDFLDRRIRALLPIPASAQGAIAIHPRTNIALIVDTANDRVLLVRLPR